MADPTFAVQFAIMGLIRTSITEIGQRVHDYVPQTSAFPYISVSVPSSVPIDEECWDRSEVMLQIDVWSNTPSSTEVKSIAPKVRDLLHETDISAAGFVVDRARVDGIFYSREDNTELHRARIMVMIEAQPV